MIVLALFVLLSVVMTKPGSAPSVLGYSSFRVLSGSMEPTIRTGSMILVKATDPSEIEPGDIISFYSSDPALRGSVNTHRVLSVDQKNGVSIFQTKGDANIIPDEYTTSGNDIIGVVVFNSYFLGLLIRLLSNPLVFVPIILVPLLLILLMNMIKTIKLAKLAAQEEEAQQIQAVKDELERRKQQRAAAEAKQEDAASDAEETEQQDMPAAEDADRQDEAPADSE
jgi:signal peptidase